MSKLRVGSIGAGRAQSPHQSPGSAVGLAVVRAAECLKAPVQVVEDFGVYGRNL
jgi:hypothetical protein